MDNRSDVANGNKGGRRPAQEIVSDQGNGGCACNFHSLNVRREEITFGRCN